MKTSQTVPDPRKRSVLFFVFEGMSDAGCTATLMSIRQSDLFDIKTISLTLEPKRTQSGMNILPDLDFIASVDLADIDLSNTAMLILPGGANWLIQNEEIFKLIGHCQREQIPVVAVGEAFECLEEFEAPLIGSANATLEDFDLLILSRLGISYHWQKKSINAEGALCQQIHPVLNEDSIYVPLWPRAVANGF